MRSQVRLGKAVAPSCQGGGQQPVGDQCPVRGGETQRALRRRRQRFNAKQQRGAEAGRKRDALPGCRQKLLREERVALATSVEPVDQRGLWRPTENAAELRVELRASEPTQLDSLDRRTPDAAHGERETRAAGGADAPRRFDSW
jgi:hypothetical protein